MRQELTEEQLNTLKIQLENKKQEQQDLDIQIKGCNFNIYEYIDMESRLKKKKAKETKQQLAQEMYANEMAIVELNRTIYNKVYNIKEPEEEENGRWFGYDIKTCQGWRKGYD